ncbi:MAG: bile acid:sodium symporter [Candidatus Methanomethylophilaceae archaeon]
MQFMSVITNIRYWIISGLLLGLLMGDMGYYAPYILTIFLIVMMCVSLEGIDFKKDDFENDRKRILIALVCCYVISPMVTLGVGMFYGDDLWIGWVLIASVPCAVSVVSSTLILKGDTKLALLSVTAVYLLAIVITPSMTYLLLGNAINPVQILKYVVLFIVIPMLVSIPLKRVHISQNTKSVSLNFCFFIMVFIAFGTNREYFIYEPVMILTVLAGCFVRVVLIHVSFETIFRFMGIDRETRIVYVLHCIWKNTGLAVTLALLLMPDMTEAAIPGAVSLPFELIYFMVMIWFYDKRVPPSESVVGRTSNS